MAAPRYLVENFFNPIMFPRHSHTSSTAVAGREDWRVGTARRSVENYWTPSTANLEAYVGVACDRPRFGDMLVIDRNTNLAGHTVRLRFSNDGFATFGEILSSVLPGQTYYASQIGSFATRTNEGAYVFHFQGQVAKEWRLYIDAMGPGLKPQVGGLYLGQSWSPTRTPLLPWDDETRELRFTEIISTSFWSGSNRKGTRRRIDGHLHLLVSDAEYQQVRYHFHGLYWRGNYMWVVPDQDQAERAGLFSAEPGVYSAPHGRDYPERQFVLTGVEHQPLATERIP